MNEEVAVEKVTASPEAGSSDGLTQYLRKINKFPLLSVEEEYDFIERWQSTRDSRAVQKVINSHLRLVAKIASGYRGYGLPMADLISEGSIGLMQALDKFEIEKGNRFSTYATWWVRAAIKDYVLKNWSSVKMGTTSAQKKLFFKLRQLKSDMLAEGEGLPEDYIERIAKELNVAPKDVMDMNQRMSGQDYSLNTQVTEGEGGEWQDWLEDERDNQEAAYEADDERVKRKALLKYALECLNEREYRIFAIRNLVDNPPTLAVVADQYGLSRERVRQIESRAYEKVKRAVKLKASEMRMALG